MILKLEVHPDVKKQVVIPGLVIPRHTTRSVITCAILDEPNLDDNTPVLQRTPKFIAKSMEKINNFGNWFLDYIPPTPKALESFNNIIKKLYSKRENSFELKESKSALKMFAIQYGKDGKMGLILIYFWLTPSSLLQTFRSTDDNIKLNSCFRV